MVLAAHLPNQYGETLRLANEEHLTLYQAEIEHLGVSHCDIGAYLLDLWGLPNPIIEAAAFHHEPQNCPVNKFSALTAVYIANVLENEKKSSGIMTYSVEFDEDYLEQVGVTERLPNWRDIAQESLATT
jgi:HD-like signal output (HDOD) protein